MLRRIIASLPASESTFAGESRTEWVFSPKRVLPHPDIELAQSLGHTAGQPRFPAHQCTGVKSKGEEQMEKESLASQQEPSLFQEVFFFCTVKNVGDVPGAGCIYVETVVDRESGIAFAKVYSTRNAMNAVDILASRVMPFFESRGTAIKEIHTRKTSEYCGLPLAHPFETFLATSQIRHLPVDLPGHPHNQLCEQFYRFLLKEFFLPALRKRFKLSLDGLQKDLDVFVEAYNAMQIRQNRELKGGLHPATNFPVDL